MEFYLDIKNPKTDEVRKVRVNCKLVSSDTNEYLDCEIYIQDEFGHYDCCVESIVLDKDEADFNDEACVKGVIYEIIVTDDYYTRCIFEEISFDEDCGDTPSAGIRYFEDRGRALLKIYKALNLNNADRPQILALLGEFAQFVEEFVNAE